MKFNPGDRCIVLPHAKADGTPEMARGAEAYFRGRVVRLVKYIGQPYPSYVYTNYWEIAELYVGSRVSIDESALEKLPPDEREPLGSWADCPWQPKVIRKTTEELLV